MIMTLFKRFKRLKYSYSYETWYYAHHTQNLHVSTILFVVRNVGYEVHFPTYEIPLIVITRLTFK